MIEIRTANGKTIPSIGLGTYPLQGRQLADITKSAIKIGYRLIDTSDDYRGEAGIGMAIQELEQEGICKREDLFIQTKISDNASYYDEPLLGIYFNNNSRFMHRHSVEDVVREKVEKSMLQLQTDYLDSLLIHLPYPDYYESIWRIMIDLKKEGKVRYIGVSNFHKQHIEELKKYDEIPFFNQIYLSPLGIKQLLVDYCINNGIQLMTYSPLVDLTKQLIPQKHLMQIMKKYNKTAAQIILRWNVDRGCLPLPKTSNVKRLKENFSIFDFSLSKDEIIDISNLNYDYQYLVESKFCPGI